MNLACPNNPPCPHGGAFHDIYEAGDPYPTCCVGDCKCGHPGEAILTKNFVTGVVRVYHADPVIRVQKQVLDDCETWVYDGETLQLDTAGEYRYQFLRPDPQHDSVWIFGRLPAYIKEQHTNGQ